MRVVLKTAILRSGKTQRAISMCVHIPEVRLSAIVRGKVDATEEEANALARELHERAEDLLAIDGDVADRGAA